MRDNPEEGELDPAECSRCKKNSLSVEKAVTMAAKSGWFTVDETGMGQFLRGNQRSPTEKGDVKDFVSKKSSGCA